MDIGTQTAQALSSINAQVPTLANVKNYRLAPDPHANQQATHAQLLKSLADGLSAFYDDLVQHGKADNVVVMTWSEFGRRVEENGIRGPTMVQRHLCSCWAVP